MIQFMVKVVDSSFMFGFRVSMALGTAFLLLLSGISTIRSLSAQPTPFQLRDMEHVAIEHRFSVLETQTQGMKEKLDDLTTHSYIELLAMSGLIGETGIRILKGKRPQ